MQPVVDLLCSATGTEWSAEHLGGGSFGLVTYLRVEGERPYIMVSAWPETMAGDSDPDAVESAGGWLIGGYGFDDDDLCLVPESGSASGLSTATVGPAVASLQAALLGDTPRVSAEASP